jgi:hypothetical protein
MADVLFCTLSRMPQFLDAFSRDPVVRGIELSVLGVPWRIFSHDGPGVPK